MHTEFKIVILPRQSMTWEEFVTTTPRRSIALDGVVRGGPRYDEATLHLNADHHDCVVREATFCTLYQIYYALKGGLMQSFGGDVIHIYINDTDQDTAFAVWLLLNYKLFEGTSGIPAIHRLMELTQRWDITAGAFPMNLSDQLVRQHAWVFEPYTELRKSGALATANEAVMRDNLDAVLNRLTQYSMSQGKERDLDTRHEILYDNGHYKIIDEIGGNEARYYLFSKGMNAYIAIVAHRPDGRMVCSVGRRSQFIPYPVPTLFDKYNAAEGRTRDNGFNGSDIVGGSSRFDGTGLPWQRLRDLTNEVLGLPN